MTIFLAIYGLIAICATAMVITRTIPIHALLYMLAALISLACMFNQMGAPFAAMLEVIVYAGAIIVLFIFVVMMINLGKVDQMRERGWLSGGVWIGPSILCFLLLATILLGFWRGGGGTWGAAPMVHEVGPYAVGLSLYGPYVMNVELASFLLLAGLVSAYHIARRIKGRM